MGKFLVGEQLSEAISAILREEGCRCAVAFWGKGALERMAGNTKDVRLICNLRTGGTNPHEIRKLARDSIRQCDTLHAKVYIGTREAIVASANVSANGLGFEDIEQAFWIEAGVKIETNSDLLKWFDGLWSASNQITDDELAKAETLWRARRAGRPPLSSFAHFDPERDDLPLLYFWEDTQWDYNPTTIEQQLGVYNEQTKSLIEDGLEIAPEDRRVMLPGTKILVLKRNKDGSLSKRSQPSWFSVGPIIENSFKYLGENQYKDTAIHEHNNPPAPFELDDQIQSIIRSVIWDGDFDDLMDSSEIGEFYTHERLSKIRAFWRECKKRYMAASALPAPK